MPPVPVYLVEEPDEADGFLQVGGFSSKDEAQKLRRLEREGRTARINLVPISQREIDYEYDR